MRIEALLTGSGPDALFKIRHLIEIINEQDGRIVALEKAEQNNNDNEDIRRALMDADNAIQKVIAHFKRTDAENKTGK